MAHTSLQACMDSSDWLHQGTMSDDISNGLDSSSSPSDCMLAAACSSRAGSALMERRLRPPHDQNLKCPRCDSTHTKFCYYNNYSLTQPRYFCKTCRRYWTKGGTLRNIPVGGGCRKNNKKSTSKKSNEHSQSTNQGGPTTIGQPSNNPTDLHLSFPEVQFPPHLANLIGLGGPHFMDGSLIRPIDFMENKYETLVGGTRLGHDFLVGSNNNGVHDQFGINMGGIGDQQVVVNGGYNGMSTVNGFNNINHDGNSAISFMDHRMLIPYDQGNNNDHHQNHEMDVKPNTKLLTLEWQDQGCTSNVGKDSSFGYHHVNGSLSSWSGHAMMGGHFYPSTTNSLV